VNADVELFDSNREAVPLFFNESLYALLVSYGLTAGVIGVSGFLALRWVWLRL
jgi:hypothetical protein